MDKKTNIDKNVYTMRATGRAATQTEGSEHYKTNKGTEPIDLMVHIGVLEGFCLGNIIKYAFRFKRTQNLEDIKKIVDYAHILYGYKVQVNIEEGEDKDGK